jgi:hypothetical protein
MRKEHGGKGEGSARTLWALCFDIRSLPFDQLRDRVSTIFKTGIRDIIRKN